MNANYVEVTRRPARIHAFAAWGWRIPFLVSIVLLAISVWIRLQLHESPAFVKMKAEGTHSKAPLTEAFGQWSNAKMALLALLGLVAGQAVVWYTGQFYALFFLQHPEGRWVHRQPADRLVAGPRHRRLHPVRLAVRQDGPQADHPRRLPDRGAHLLPAVQLMTEHRQSGADQAHENVAGMVIADPADCSFQFNPTGTAKFTKSCDIAKALLARARSTATTVDAPGGTIATCASATRRSPPTIRQLRQGRRRSADRGRLSAAPTTDGGEDPIDPKAGLANFAQMFDIFRAQTLTLIGILTILVI